MISEEVSHGYLLPLPLSKITRVPGILLAHLNIQRQNTIDEEGNIIEKDRLTHDQSFKFSGSNFPSIPDLTLPNSLQVFLDG